MTRFDEIRFLAALRHSRRRPAQVIGIGDDLAWIRGDAKGRGLLIGSDMLLDGVHFDTRRHTPRAIGRKAVNCNLSDCAAMAVRPLAVTVSLALPRGSTHRQARELLRGAEEAANAFGAVVAGGDTTVWSCPLAVDVAVVAEPFPGIEPVSRSGARVGDRILVTGSLGGSGFGKHMTFTPRVEEANRLAKRLGTRLHAMMDISDGLLLDLHRLCEASGTGADLEEDQLKNVVSRAARRASKLDGRSAMSHALSDGEDFELLLAADVTDDACRRIGVPLFPIGTIVRSGLALCAASGRRRRLKPEGFVHR